MTGETLRLDKWLWFARFVKTRSLATKLVIDGRMRVNGAPTQKAHYAVKTGDVLTFPLGPHIRVIKVLALGSRRGPAHDNGLARSFHCGSVKILRPLICNNSVA